MVHPFKRKVPGIKSCSIKKHVLFFSPTGHMGGAERNLVTMCNGLQSGYSIHVVMPNEGVLATELKPFVKTITYFSGYLLRSGQIFNVFLSVIWLVCKLRFQGVRMKDMDIIHANSIFSLYIPVWLGKIFRKKTIVHWADFDTRKGDIDVINISPRARVLAVSKSIKDALIHAGMKSDQVDVVYNGTDLPTDVECRDLRQDLGIPKDGIIFGITGRIDAWKGHMYLLKAMALLNDSNIFLVVLGDFHSLKDNDYLSNLHDYISKHQLKDHVFFTGRVADPQAYVANMDVVCVPSEYEPFGLVAIEAMAMKKPVIASNTGGLAEIVVHKVSGLLCEPKQEQAFANAMKTLALNKSVREAYGKAGYERFVNNFETSIFINRIKHIYESM